MSTLSPTAPVPTSVPAPATPARNKPVTSLCRAFGYTGSSTRMKVAKFAEYIPIIGTIVGVGHLVYTLAQKIKGRGNCGSHALRSAIAITSCGAILILFDLVAEYRRKRKVSFRPSPDALKKQRNALNPVGSSNPKSRNTALKFDTTNFPTLRDFEITITGEKSAKISSNKSEVKEAKQCFDDLEQFAKGKGVTIVLENSTHANPNSTKPTYVITITEGTASMQKLLEAYGKAKLTPTT